MKRYSGIVERGPRRGTRLGFPTANIRCADSEVSGIYAALVYIKDKPPHSAAVYADTKRGVLEAHILDFSGDLYGLTITMELHKKIREDETFKSDDVLRKTIARDIQKVREYFKK